MSKIEESPPYETESNRITSPAGDFQIKLEANRSAAVKLLQSIAAQAVLLQALVLSGTFDEDGEYDNFTILIHDLKAADKILYNYG